MDTEHTVALFPVRSQLVGRVAHADVRSQRVVATVSAVAGFCLALVDVCDKNTQKRKDVIMTKRGCVTRYCHETHVVATDQ